MATTTNRNEENVKSFTAKAKTAVENSGLENWDDVKDKATEVYSTVKDVAGQYAERVQEGATDAVKQVTKTVKQYPFQAILIGFGVGAAIGLLLGSRRS